jgi:hypothetical protein
VVTANPAPKSRSGSEKRRRHHTKLIRFDDDELAQVEESASRAGLTLSSYGRAQMLGAPAPRSVRRPPFEKELLAKVLGQLGRIGGNLNQVAKAVNTTGAEEEEVRAVVAEVRAAAQEIMRALGRPV